MKTIRKPTHPGEVLLEDVLKPLGLTLTEAARDLGVNRKTLSAIVKGKCSLTVEMAIRIAQATGTSPESWLNMQTKLNLWQALKNKPRNIVLFPRLDKVAIPFFSLAAVGGCFRFFRSSIFFFSSSLLSFFPSHLLFRFKYGIPYS